MRSKHLLFLIFIASVFAGCGNGSRRFSVIGDISNMPQQTVVLEQVTINDIISIVDSQESKPDGHFELSGISPDPSIYRLRFKGNRYLLLSIEKGNIKVNADWNKLDSYTVAGSPASQNIKVLLGINRRNAIDFITMKSVLDTLRAQGKDSMLTIAKKNYEDMKRHFTDEVEAYADTSSYEANAIFAARMLNPGSELPFLETFTQNLNHRFTDTKLTKEFVDYFNKITAKQKQPVQRTTTIDEGAIAPEVTLPDATGNNISLSSFKGRYVLLDFWASWCGPCRGENPNVVAAYEKYKDKNFTIYSVSLDNNRDAWLKAIKDDNLTWTQVSDLRGWASAAAAIYGVQSIPTNFLIDPHGKIIARNLRGSSLLGMLDAVYQNAKP